MTAASSLVKEEIDATLTTAQTELEPRAASMQTHTHGESQDQKTRV